MRKIWTPAAVLLIAALVLMLTYSVTLQVRRDNAEQELQEKMETLLPGSKSFKIEEYTGDDSTIEFVYKGETGYVIGTTTSGYAGTLKMLVGVSDDGVVTGLQIRSMEETLGLGGNALYDWKFLSQFLNTDGNAAVGEDIDAISGATVTSKAVTRSVNAAVAVVTGSDADSGATSWGG